MSQTSTGNFSCEAEVANGLEGIVHQELASLAEGVVRNAQLKPGAVQFEYRGNIATLLRVRSANSIYLLHQFSIPRPKALLGHQNLTRLLNLIETAINITGFDQFRSLYLSAAGSDSSVMNRLKTELAQATGLQVADDSGDLWIRVRRSEIGWDVLIRISPRPLATRNWRVCNMKGALNGPVAYAMMRMTNPTPSDTFLNLACGSGTILIERALYGAVGLLTGCDFDDSALNCARQNINAAQSTAAYNLLQSDITCLPLPESTVDAICADLPFGQLTGSHQNNLRMYPLLLESAARVAKVGAKCVLLTHEVRLMESLLAQSRIWLTIDTLKVELRGLHPRIYVLERV